MNNYMTDDKLSTPRKRTRATPEQLSVLEKTFNVNPSPNNRVREQLSRELGMSERSIQIWFQNRRAKVKNVAKKSSMLHDETLRMQYYASSAAAAACQAAVYHQYQQQNGVKPTEIDIGDPIKTNPDLYYYYYYYYFNQQQQRPKHMYQPYNTQTSSVPPPPISLKSMPPPPPPPPTTNDEGSISPSLSDLSNWSKKNRTRAHTVGPYYPTMIQEQQQLQQNKLFDRGSSVEMSFKTSMLPSNNYTNMLNNSSLPFDNLSVLPSYQTEYFDNQQQQQQWNELPFYQDNNMLNIMPNSIHISAQALQIGTWKRMGFECNDLLCQYDKQKKSFSWCIQDGPSRFKMEFHQSFVKSIQLYPLENNRPGWARLEISVVPTEISFYMQVRPDWIQCRDYTEDKQASMITVHQLDGPYLTLKAELEALKTQDDYFASILL
ncbi:hypothetical protein MFLAVUS_001861 [Mucor flavus]|uniref:Homeobox domain-containing protein n=1 Tax=Mucor flavus TaxID=439312 RepID=A0ABP9YNM2_9FUNG